MSDTGSEETRSGKRSRASPSRISRASQPPPLIPLIPLLKLKGDNDAAHEESPAPPSPVPTEIVDNVPEDYVRTAKSFGIKVRDFAYEPQRPTTSVPKEVWVDPWRTLVVHDQHVKCQENPKYQLSGKFLRRLLDVGFVTEEEAKHNWTEVDKERLKDWDDGGFGARGYIISKHRGKPTVAARERMRVAIFGDRSTRKTELYAPPDTPDLLDDEKMVDEFISEHNTSRDELFFTGYAGPTRKEMKDEGEFLRTYTIPFFADSPSASTSDVPTSTTSPRFTSPFSRATTPERPTMTPISNLPRANDVAGPSQLSPKHEFGAAEMVPTPPTSPAQATPVATPSVSTIALPATPTHTTPVMTPATTPEPAPMTNPGGRSLGRTETCLRLHLH